MKFTEALQIEEDMVEAVQQHCSKLRGEITRLQEHNRELVRDYAKLNDEHDGLLDQRELLIQSAVNKYAEMCPDFEELSVFGWSALWHDIADPIELDVRCEMRKRGCVMKLWSGQE